MQHFFQFRLAGFLFIALLFSSRNMAQSTQMSAQAPDNKAKIDELIKSMTLDEKIGQLSLFTSDWDKTGPSLNSNYKKLIRKGEVGAIFNAYTVDYVRDLQRIAVEDSRLKIPLIFGYDVIHGHRTIFPIPLGQACSWDLAAIEHAERIAAIEATAEGINWTLPRWSTLHAIRAGAGWLKVLVKIHGWDARLQQQG